MARPMGDYDGDWFDGKCSNVGMTPDEIAAELNIPMTFVSDWLNGDPIPHDEVRRLKGFFRKREKSMQPKTRVRKDLENPYVGYNLCPICDVNRIADGGSTLTVQSGKMYFECVGCRKLLRLKTHFVM